MLQYAAEDVFKVLVACKSDMDSTREISDEEGARLAADHGMRFFATSARDNTGVTEVSRGMCCGFSFRLPLRPFSGVLLEVFLGCYSL